LPMIRSDKVTTGISHNRAVEILHGLDDILSETIFIGERVAGVVDATVDAATHVSRDCPLSLVHVNIHWRKRQQDILGEAAIGVVFDLGELVRGIDSNDWLLAIRDLGEARHVAFPV
jgi:hypothetical protein